jgi:acetyl esterase/lipase
MGKSKFSSFDKLDLAFASINGHKLEATILTPKKLQEKASGIYPVLVYWHGGGFVVGHRMYEPWWSNWQVDLDGCLHCIQAQDKS